MLPLSVSASADDENGNTNDSKNSSHNDKVEEGLSPSPRDHPPAAAPSNNAINRKVPPTTEIENEPPPSQQQQRPENLLGQASEFSRWFYLWASPLLKVGATKPLEDIDLPSLLDEDSSTFNRKIIENLSFTQNNNDIKKKKRSLFHDICIAYLKETWFSQLLLMISMAARIGQAVALGLLLDEFTDDDNNNKNDTDKDSINAMTTTDTSFSNPSYLWMSILIICGAVLFPAKQRQFFHTYRRGMQLRTGLVASIFHKSLRLQQTFSSNHSDDEKDTKKKEEIIRDNIGGSRGGSSAAHVTNLASNDVERFLMASVTGIYLIWGPLETIVILIIGSSEQIVIGPAFCLGYVLLFFFILLQAHWSKKFSTLRRQVAASTDARIGLVSQIITGARVVKMNAWEHQFADRIEQLRSTEMNIIQRSNKYKALNEAAYYCSSLVVSVMIFCIHVVAMGGTLSSKNVFTTFTLVNISQFTMTKLVPTAIMSVSESHVSSQRIQAFLELPELESSQLEEERSLESSCHPNPDKNGKDTNSTKDKRKVLLSLSDSTFCWNTTTATTDPSFVAAISSISLEFQAGQLYYIIGKVGCGKSGLLQALAGELKLREGSVSRRYASMAYAPQDPWIMNGTARNNICLGLDFDEDWYGRVIQSCGLESDFAQWQHGDNTILGDRGVQCSGGQRARIGLARALYRDPQILLLDDPMSAVDTKVGRKIYQSAIQTMAVQRGKCVVLATHQHQFVVGTTAPCILMDGGKIRATGTYADCMGTDASASQIGHSSFPMDQDDVDALMADETEKWKREEGAERGKGDLIVSSKAKTNDEHKEGRTTGIVRPSTWLEYAKAMGGVSVAIALFLSFSFTQAASLVSIVEVGLWAEEPPDDQKTSKWLAIVLGLTAGTVLLAISRALLSLYFCTKASQRLHDAMTQSVLFSRISFFDTNPSGRILNRFSADVGIADEQLPLTIYDFLVGCFMALGGVATAIAVLPMILVSIPPCVWYFWQLRQIFVATTRELKRLEGLARSPIFEMMTESLHGITTIRGNGALDYFKQKFEAAHDAHSRAYFSFVAASRWFATRMEFITFFLMSAATTMAVLCHSQGWLDINPAVLGLALTLLLQLAGTNFPWMVRQSAEVVNQMVSVERVAAFGHLPTEGALVTQHDDADNLRGWPKDPSMVVDNLTVRYRPELNPSLCGVSFSVESGMRVGVVGRTGSGKSTLVHALFRLLEAESGSVSVDGVDIATVGLHKLRSAISVIPQAPILFTGCSVRENLDPFGDCTETMIRDALEDVQMMSKIDELPKGLDFMVSEGGGNFSVGERQLLCLARAILRGSSILVLDEATANVDSHTEALLKHALQKSFAGATIIMIAHRLHTVIDFDRILVLGDGEVLEYGSPKELLSSNNHSSATGAFAAMVEHTGEEMAKNLHRMAQCEREAIIRRNV